MMKTVYAGMAVLALGLLSCLCVEDVSEATGNWRVATSAEAREAIGGDACVIECWFEENCGQPANIDCPSCEGKPVGASCQANGVRTINYEYCTNCDVVTNEPGKTNCVPLPHNCWYTVTCSTCYFSGWNMHCNRDEIPHGPIVNRIPGGPPCPNSETI